MNLMLLEQENQDLKRRVDRLEKAMRGLVQTSVRPEKINRLDDVLKLVCAEYGLTMQDMMSHRREQWRAYPRQVALYLCREHLRIGGKRPTLQRIGHAACKLDHGTVSHAVKRVKDIMETEPTERERILRLAKAITA